MGLNEHNAQGYGEIQGGVQVRVVQGSAQNKGTTSDESTMACGFSVR